MMKNRAVWVALVVVAAAALLMFFVVLPQVREDKTAEELAKKAGETVEQTKDAASKTIADSAKTATDAAADVKSGVLAKMARMKAETSAATTEFEALLADGKAPTAEQLAAARAKIEAALKVASDMKVPEGIDAATSELVAKSSEGAKKALAALESMPTDVDGAKKALEGVKSTVVAALDSGEAAKTATEPLTDAAQTNTQPADEKQAASTQTLPAFDVLRVEPDGATVIAGRAQPGTKIEVLDGDKAIASTDAGVTGDFVAILDNPLTAGDHQLVLQSTGKDGKKSVSVEVATVSVPKDKSGNLLAMVTKPGEASRIMSMPDAKKDAVVADNAKQSNTGEKVVAIPDLPAASTDLAGSAPTVDQDAAKVNETANADTATAPDTKAAETKVAAAEKTSAETAAPEVLVSAVEIEGDKIFIAGTTRPKSVVRVYADDKLVAEVSSDENGRFVADNTMKLAVGNHTIRADVLSGDGKKVELRASVPFFRPEGDQLAAVAGDGSKPGGKEMQPLADGAYDKAREEAGKAMALLKGLYDAGKVPTAEELAAARSSTEIALKTLSQMKLPDDGNAVAKQMAAKTAEEASKALAMLKALPEDAKAVKSALASIDVAVTSAVAPSIEALAADKAKPEAEKLAQSDPAKAADATAKAEPEAKTSGAKQSQPVDRDSRHPGEEGGAAGRCKRRKCFVLLFDHQPDRPWRHQHRGCRDVRSTEGDRTGAAHAKPVLGHHSPRRYALADFSAGLRARHSLHDDLYGE
jgi:nucleoid-associated protein YgaU